MRCLMPSLCGFHVRPSFSVTPAPLYGASLSIDVVTPNGLPTHITLSDSHHWAFPVAFSTPDFPTTDLLLIIHIGRKQLIVVVVKLFWCTVPEPSITKTGLVTTILGGINWPKFAGALDPTCPYLIDLRGTIAWRL